MANENPPPLDDRAASPAPAPSAIEVLLAGNLADDDMMWVVRCPATELPRLVRSPVEWVAALASLPGWAYFGTSEPAPAPTLTRDFAMSVQTTDAADPLGRIVVEGISGTNALTVVASAPEAAAVAAALGLAPAAPGQGPFQTFWDDVSRDPDNPPSLKKRLPVNVAAPIGRFFGHFEILDRAEDPAARALRTATFLLAASLDPAGYAAMLNGLDQETLYVGSPAIETPTAPVASATAGEPLSFSPAASPSLVYANVEGTGEGDDDETTTCGVVAGSTQGPDGTVAGTTVKRYGGGDAPTEGDEPIDHS